MILFDVFLHPWHLSRLAKNTYRLKCQGCKKTSSFTRNLDYIRTQVEIRFDMVDIEEDNEVEMVPVCTAEAKRRADGREIEKDTSDPTSSVWR